jgi:hypothetical protein
MIYIYIYGKKNRKKKLEITEGKEIEPKEEKRKEEGGGGKRK